MCLIDNNKLLTEINNIKEEIKAINKTLKELKNIEETPQHPFLKWWNENYNKFYFSHDLAHDAWNEAIFYASEIVKEDNFCTDQLKIKIKKLYYNKEK